LNVIPIQQSLVEPQGQKPHIKKFVERRFHTYRFNKNKKGYTLQYNFFTFLAAPLFVERCNYNAMIEFVTIRKLRG
jgi:hypothetical protein